MNHRGMLCLAAIVVLTASAPAVTTVGGVIRGDVRWAAEKGPYLVNRDILVTPRGRLTIEPGCVLMIGKPLMYDDSIPQIDDLDSETVAIKVNGALYCEGRRAKRISISSAADVSSQCGWYGIILDGVDPRYNEFAFTDVAGACHGITVKQCKPVIRNCIIEYNNVGVTCSDRGDARLYNCAVAHNFTTGIMLSRSNPTILNCLIVYNRNNGLWCDRVSQVTLQYNCIYGNADGNLLDCDPAFGLKSKVGPNRKDSTDASGNLYCNPIFAGSTEDSLAVERDVSLPTDKSRIIDTTIAKELLGTLTDSTAIKARLAHHKRFALSKYSPCRNAGSPDRRFRNDDGTRCDIGIYGGPEFLQNKQQ